MKIVLLCHVYRIYGVTGCIFKYGVSVEIISSFIREDKKNFSSIVVLVFIVLFHFIINDLNIIMALQY